MTNYLKPCWTIKSVLDRYNIKSLIDRLPSLRSRVRYAHTATQTPRKKMANAIILPLPTRRLKKDFFVYLCNCENIRALSL